jgi:hypothetical protein
MVRPGGTAWCGLVTFVQAAWCGLVHRAAPCGPVDQLFEVDLVCPRRPSPARARPFFALDPPTAFEDAKLPLDSVERQFGLDLDQILTWETTSTVIVAVVGKGQQNGLGRTTANLRFDHQTDDGPRHQSSPARSITSVKSRK